MLLGFQDLTPYNFAFLLYLKTNDSNCEANIVAFLDSEGEDFASELTALVNWLLGLVKPFLV